MLGVYVDDVFFYLMSFKHNRIINDEQHNTKNRIYDDDDEYTIHKEFRIITDEEKKIHNHISGVDVPSMYPVTLFSSVIYEGQIRTIFNYIHSYHIDDWHRYETSFSHSLTFTFLFDHHI